MAKSSTSYQYQSFTSFRLALTASYQDLATGAADDSDVVEVVVTNTGASSRTLTVAYNQASNDDTIAVVTVPASTGIAAGNNAIRLIQGNYLPGTYYNRNGNLIFNLKNGEKLRVKQDTGTDLLIVGKQLNY
ncbi:MAG TPA: hypothetical protein PLN38_16930 [Chitinophagales bacterium]|nr:hypothetical protein [Chitinophagales bacterium]